MDQGSFNFEIYISLEREFIMRLFIESIEPSDRKDYSIWLCFYVYIVAFCSTFNPFPTLPFWPRILTLPSPFGVIGLFTYRGFLGIAGFLALKRISFLDSLIYFSLTFLPSLGLVDVDNS